MSERKGLLGPPPINVQVEHNRKLIDELRNDHDELLYEFRIWQTNLIEAAAKDKNWKQQEGVTLMVSIGAGIGRVLNVADVILTGIKNAWVVRNADITRITLLSSLIMLILYAIVERNELITFFKDLSTG